MFKKFLKYLILKVMEGEEMKEEHVVIVILAVGILISLITRRYIGIVLSAIGIPLYLAYISREQNILAKSRLFERDLFLMMTVTIFIVLAFEYFSDPRLGLVGMALFIPIVFYVLDKLKTRE
jgi:hypothetical protein